MMRSGPLSDLRGGAPALPFTVSFSHSLRPLSFAFSHFFRFLFHPRPSSSSLALPLVAEAFCYTVSMAFSDYPFQRHSRNVTVIAPPQHDLKGTGRYFIKMVTAPRRACLGEVTAPEWVEWTVCGSLFAADVCAVSDCD